MWQILGEYFVPFLEATGVTLKLTAVSFMKISKNRGLRAIAYVYITVIRGTPLIVQLMFLYFGITAIVVLSSFWAGSLALAVHAGACVAELYGTALSAQAENFMPFETYVVAGMYYLVLVLIFSLLVSRLEKRMDPMKGGVAND